jgi:guanylate kinase
MELFPDGIYFFIEPPDLKELEKRLRKRNTDRDEDIEGRLVHAAEELKYKKDYTYIIENRTVGEAVEKILSILDSEIGQR